MNRVGRLSFLGCCAALLAWGIVGERHSVKPLGEGEAQRISGAGLVEGATVDNYMLREGELFDVYSLSKATAGIKDCKT